MARAPTVRRKMQRAERQRARRVLRAGADPGGYRHRHRALWERW